jgi:hypothetical protein
MLPLGSCKKEQRRWPAEWSEGKCKSFGWVFMKLRVAGMLRFQDCSHHYLLAPPFTVDFVIFGNFNFII